MLVVYGYSSVSICGGATGSHVTGSDVSHMWPEASSAHAQTEVANIRLFHRKWRQSHDRKYVLRMCNRKLGFPAFFLTLVVVPWIPKVTRRVCACATGGCALYTGSWLQEVRVSRVVVQGVFSTTSASSPGYLPLSRHFHFTGSHFIFI